MKTGSFEPARYQAPAVQKAFQLLTAVAGSPKPLKLSELSRRLGFSKGTTHGLIQALVKIQALEKHTRLKTYFLGPALLELAFKNWNYFQMIEKVRPVLDDLRDRTGETVFFGLLSRSRAIIAAGAEAVKPIKISSPPGTSLPLLAGAVGKVFLADLDEKTALSVIRELGLRRFTDRSVTDEQVYLDQLARVREQGYALDEEEYLEGVKAVAVNLGSHRGLTMAVWVVGFSRSMGSDAMPHIIRSILDTGKKLRSMLDGAA